MSTAKRAGLGAWLVSVVQQRVFGLPPRRNGYTVERGVPVPTRDGVRLLTDHYAPIGPARGTVLIRTPYGRGLPEGLLHGRMLAERGYHVVIQSVRGTGGSGGVFHPIAQETDDAQDAVAWLREQSWFAGNLATLGGSYLGWTQWALMRDTPAELRAAVVLVGPHDFGRAMHGTGTMALADFLGWSATIEAQAQGLRAVVAARRRVTAALRQPTPAGAAATALGDGAPWFGEWLGHTDLDDPYWRPYDASSALRDTAIPVLVIGGWQDVFVDQTLAQYHALSAHNRNVAMTIGPWTHVDTAVKAAKVVDTDALAWLDHQVAGSGPAREAPVRIYVTGAREWRSFTSWPPRTGERVLRLDAGGRLLDNAAAKGAVAFTCLPDDPTPSVGGRHMSPGAGRQDNSGLERRADVAVFTSDPLGEDLEVFGCPRVELAVEAEGGPASVFVRLCDVDGRGRSWNVTEAFVPVATRSATTVDLGACAHRFRAGHRLRVQVSGGAYPRYARNPNTVRYTIGCGGSSLTLPWGTSATPSA